ncbi:MAG TPA: hypothetical protein VIH75_11955 [Candidatus Sulfotelmatobacter sp.]
MYPSLKHALLDWKSQSLYNQPEHFIFPSEKLKGNKPLDLASVLKKKVQPAFKKIGIAGVGWHTFRTRWEPCWRRWTSISSHPRLLAAQQPSRHEQVPAGDIEDQTLGTRQIGRRDFADGSFAEDKPNPMSAVWNRSGMGPFSFSAYRPLTSPNLPDARVASA